MLPTTSDIYARVYHYVSSTCHFVRGTYARVCHHDSSICHPRRVKYMQKQITIMTPVYATHNEWHICKSILPSWLWYMPPMASDIYARAYYHHDSSICHPWRVTCMQEHDAQNPGQTIPWLIVRRACKTQGPPLVSPTDSHHRVFNTCHFVRDTYARACHYVSSTCHSRGVPCMQEHNTFAAYKTQ